MHVTRGRETVGRLMVQDFVLRLLEGRESDARLD